MTGLAVEHSAVVLDEGNASRLPAPPQRQHQPPTGPELSKPRFGDVPDAHGGDHMVEGGILGSAECSIAGQDANPFIAGRAKCRSGAGSDFIVNVSSCDLAAGSREFGQQGSVVAGAGAALVHPVARTDLQGNPASQRPVWPLKRRTGGCRPEPSW